MKVWYPKIRTLKPNQKSTNNERIDAIKNVIKNNPGCNKENVYRRVTDVCSKNTA